MKDSILAIRRNDALHRIETALEALETETGAASVVAPIPAVANKDAGVKQMMIMEQIATRLEAVAREVAPDYMPSLDITPTAAAFAEQHGVDLLQVEGTGVEGRILKSDVLTAIDAQAEAEAEQARQEAIAQAEANITLPALKAAREAGIEPTTITGTGTDGKITKADVDAAIEALG